MDELAKRRQLPRRRRRTRFSDEEEVDVPHPTRADIEELLIQFAAPANRPDDWPDISRVLERAAARHQLPVPWLGNRVPPPPPPLRLVRRDPVNATATASIALDILTPAELARLGPMRGFVESLLAKTDRSVSRDELRRQISTIFGRLDD